METTDAKTEEQVLEDKIENLIAIGAATAANCIFCFEHLYEKAINSGITWAESGNGILVGARAGSHT